MEERKKTSFNFQLLHRSDHSLLNELTDVVTVAVGDDVRVVGVGVEQFLSVGEFFKFFWRRLMCFVKYPSWC